MTDTPDPSQDRPDRPASDPQPDGPSDPQPDRQPDHPSDGNAPGPSPRDVPSADRSEAADGFDAAFQGESWDAPRRRRSSSGSSSPGSSRSGSSRSGSSRSRWSRSARSSTRSADPLSAAGTRPAEAAAAGTGRPQRSRGSRRLRHTRAVVVHVVLGVLALGLAWVVVTGALAAYQLSQARSDITTLRSQLTGGGDQIGATADELAAHAHHAAVLTRGPAWATLAAVPWVGTPFEAVRGITTQTSVLADDAVPGLVAAAADVNPRTVVQSGTVDLAAVQRAAGPVHSAALRVTAASDRVAALPDRTWLPVVDTARSDLATQLRQLGSTLTTTDQALQVLPTMLGADGRPRRYFVAFQNNAELRGAGGLPGAFAIVTAADGKVSIDRFESDTLLAGVKSGLDFGKAFDVRYGADGTYDEYVGSNSSPHFPYAAQIWCAMWRNVSGEQLDGAITVDPGALSYLLKATGPAAAPDGTAVTAANVVALLQSDVYAKFPDRGENDDRKNYILGVAEAAEKKILSGAGNSRALLDGLAQGVSERRIVAWSSDPAVETVLASAPIGGTVRSTDQPFSMLSLNNGAGGKLDYYLGRKVTVERTGCGDTRTVTVTVQLTNNAPPSGLPPYVYERIDDPPYPTVPGQNRTVVDYIATDGARLLSATLDGTPSGASVFDEQGHPEFQTILESTPGQTRTWVLTLQEPAGDQPVTVEKQPGVTPIDVVVDDRSCT